TRPKPLLYQGRDQELGLFWTAVIQRPVFYIPFLIIRNPVWQMRCVNFLKQTLESNAHHG
ncbi:MAG: hypothetical protein WAZ30_13315, partial [Syntrophorhabdus sp.]